MPFDHIAQHPGVVDYHAGPKQVLVVGLPLTDVPEETGAEHLGERLLPDVVHGEVNEDAGLTVAPGVDVEV